MLILAWIVDLLDALQFLHLRGIVHQQLTLENVLLFENMKVKLGNFTKAKSVLILDEIPFVHEETQLTIPEYAKDLTQFSQLVLQILHKVTAKDLQLLLASNSREKLFQNVLIRGPYSSTPALTSSSSSPSLSSLAAAGNSSQSSSAANRLSHKFSLSNLASALPIPPTSLSSTPVPPPLPTAAVLQDSQMQAGGDFEKKLCSLLIVAGQDFPAKNRKHTKQLFEDFFALMEEHFLGDPRDKDSIYRKPIKRMEMFLRVHWKGYENQQDDASELSSLAPSVGRSSSLEECGQEEGKEVSQPSNGPSGVDSSMHSMVMDQPRYYNVSFNVLSKKKGQLEETKRSLTNQTQEGEEIFIDHRRNLVYWLIKELSCSLVVAEEIALALTHHGVMHKDHLKPRLLENPDFLVQLKVERSIRNKIACLLR
jgi:serine/threonine protein kinase